MSVYIKDQSKLWPRIEIVDMGNAQAGPQDVVGTLGYARVVPYYTKHLEVHRPITAVNRQLGGLLFWRIDDLKSFQNSPGCTYYVEICKGGGSCTVGFQSEAGGQILRYESVDDNLIHELGHCLGLGHENFHPEWPGVEEIISRGDDDAHKVQYLANRLRYMWRGDFDGRSAMLYSDDAFLGSLGAVATAALMQSKDKGRRGSLVRKGPLGDDLRVLNLDKGPSVEKKVSTRIGGKQRRFSGVGIRALEVRHGKQARRCLNNSFSRGDIALIKRLYKPCPLLP